MIEFGGGIDLFEFDFFEGFVGGVDEYGFVEGYDVFFGIGDGIFDYDEVVFDFVVVDEVIYVVIC